jgi:hypothetical protein
MRFLQRLPLKIYCAAKNCRDFLVQHICNKFNNNTSCWLLLTFLYNRRLYIYVLYYIHDNEYDNMFAHSKDNIQTSSHNYKSLQVQYIYHLHRLCSTFLLFLEHQTVVDPVQTNICHTWRPQSLSYFLFSYNEVVFL